MKKVFFLAGVFLAFCVLVITAYGKTKKSKEVYSSSFYCGGCHQDIYEKWKNSLHAKAALEDPIFDAAYMEALKLSGGSAKMLCLKCHAPTVLVTKDYDLKLPITKEGILCDFCHTVKAVFPGKPDPFLLQPGNTKFGPYKNIQSPAHQTAHSPVHAKSEFCGSCHQYNSNGIEIMSTYTEWKKSPYFRKNVQCQNCHMPAIKGKVVDPTIKTTTRIVNLHDVQGGHSLAQLKKAVSVKVETVRQIGNEISVVVILTNKGSGHKVPTGIPSRALVLRVSVQNSGGEVHEKEKVFKKVLADKNGKILHTDAEIMLYGAKIIKDNRLVPGKKTVVKFSFYHPKKEKLTVSAQLSYQYKPKILVQQDMTVEMSEDRKFFP